MRVCELSPKSGKGDAVGSSIGTKSVPKVDVGPNEYFLEMMLLQSVLHVELVGLAPPGHQVWGLLLLGNLRTALNRVVHFEETAGLGAKLGTKEGA